MKLIVKNTFRDKQDHVTVYASGGILEVKDKKRATDLVSRGLCAVYEATETEPEPKEQATETEPKTETDVETETGTETGTETETEPKTAKGNKSKSKK